MRVAIELNSDLVDPETGFCGTVVERVERLAKHTAKLVRLVRVRPADGSKKLRTYRVGRLQVVGPFVVVYPAMKVKPVRLFRPQNMREDVAQGLLERRRRVQEPVVAMGNTVWPSVAERHVERFAQEPTV